MVDPFLDDLRRPRPDPGGGAAAAHSALLGIALSEKIVCLERKRFAGKHPESELWEDCFRKVSRLTDSFTRLRSEDVDAYKNLAEALGGGEDAARLHRALAAAIQCPLDIMREARKALDLVEEVGGRCRRFLVADVLVACELLGAAILGACHIAIANLPLIQEASLRARWLEELTRERNLGNERLNGVRADLEVRNAAGGG
jgi:formiminotetrahydrofolate cyclodeaminase